MRPQIPLPTSWHKPGATTIVFILAVLVLTAVEPAISRGMRSAGVILETIPGNRFRPLSLLKPKPHRAVIDLAWKGKTIEADVYDPGNPGRKPGLILLNGIVREGRRYGPLVNLAQALSRAGFIVMVPDLLSYSRFHLVPDDIDVLTTAFEILTDYKDVDPLRVGFIGFSVGGSLAFIATAENRIAQDVRFVAMIGSYSDLERVIMEVTTTSYLRDGSQISFQPDSFVWIVTRNTLVATLNQAEDRAILHALFSGSRPEPNHADLQKFDRTHLSTTGQHVYDIFTNRESHKVDGLVSKLPQQVLRSLRRLNPVDAIDGVKAHVLLLHESGDPFFPSWESETLFKLLPDDQARLTLTKLVHHAELRLPPITPKTLVSLYLPESWKLGAYVFSIISLAESASLN